mmetsp:Transcript_13739/g.35256  ORF Transcript_13739/g.35256 Transcript_13739/m.35256 type:complete len:397 (-) Transcript_13739:52-1242(-)
MIVEAVPRVNVRLIVLRGVMRAILLSVLLGAPGVWGATIPTNPTAVPHPQYVVVVAQGRSGSTLLGDLLCLHRPDVFGIFEPYHDFPDVTVDAQPLHRDGTAGPPRGLTWQSLLDCSFTNDPDVLGAVAWRGQGRHKLADQIKHLHPHPEGGRQWDAPPRPFREERLFRLRPGVGREGFDARYTPYVKTACQASQVRVVKTIRLAGPLLNDFVETVGTVTPPPESPPLKVIHLIRNPVDVALSWQKFTQAREARWKGPPSVFDFDSRMRLMCSKSGDTIFALNATFAPENMLVVRFEDLVATAVPTMSRIFRFIGLQFKQADEAAITAALRLMHGPGLDDANVTGEFGVFGDNAVVKSRHGMGVSQTIKQITAETLTTCAPVAELGGYSVLGGASR